MRNIKKETEEEIQQKEWKNTYSYGRLNPTKLRADLKWSIDYDLEMLKNARKELDSCPPLSIVSGLDFKRELLVGYGRIRGQVWFGFSSGLLTDTEAEKYRERMYKLGEGYA